MDHEIAIVGGGTAGLTAALFAARHGRDTVLLDPLGMGGAILNTERVEDYPGFPEGVPGYELGPRIQEQVAGAGGTFELGEVGRVEPRDGGWAVVTDSGELVVGAVIVATGSTPRTLGMPREDEFRGKGLSNCASCDGPLYRGKAVVMVGGGDSALLETIELTRHEVEVMVIDADETLSGQATYTRRVTESAQVEIRHRTVLEEILGDGRVAGVRVCDLATGESSTLPVEGVFVHVGRLPNTAFLEGVLTLDLGGHVPTDIWMRTKLPGLFAAGDVRADAARQAITAAGDGATAAIAAHRYLAETCAVRAWRLSESFGIDRLDLEDRPDPELGHGERARRVRAVSLNYRDVAMVEHGIGPRGVDLPLLPCSDAAARSSRLALASRGSRSVIASRAPSSNAGSTAIRSRPQF